MQVLFFFLILNKNLSEILFLFANKILKGAALWSAPL